MAIDDLLDEHEQSERVLAWLRSNGAGLIGGVILGLALIIGWQWWGSRQASADMQEGNDYQAMLDSLEAKDITKAQSQAADRKSVVECKGVSFLVNLGVRLYIKQNTQTHESNEG